MNIGPIVHWLLSQNRKADPKSSRMFVVQGLITSVIGILTYWWIVDFPENAGKSFLFLDKAQTQLAVARIQTDRGDVQPKPFTWSEIFRHFLDPKIYGFAALFFCLNLVSTGEYHINAPSWAFRSIPDSPCRLRSFCYLRSDSVYELVAFARLMNNSDHDVCYSSLILPSYHPKERHGVLREQVNPPLSTTILLCYNPCTFVVFHQRQVQYSRAYHNLQLTLPDNWLLHAWLSQPSHGPLYWDLPRDWSIYIELGSYEYLSSCQYHRPMETGCHGCYCNSVQWIRRHRWELHREADRSTTVSDCDLGGNWFPHGDYCHRRRLFNVLFRGESPAGKREEGHRAYRRLPLYILKSVDCN